MANTSRVFRADYHLWRSDWLGSQDSLLLEHRTPGRKVASSNPGRSGRRIFLSTVNFVCWLFFGARSTSVFPQWHVTPPPPKKKKQQQKNGHSVRSAGGMLHLNTPTPLTKRSRSGLTMPLSRQSVETYQETSSHATRQGKLGHTRLSSLSHCGLILA